MAQFKKIWPLSCTLQLRKVLDKGLFSMEELNLIHAPLIGAEGTDSCGMCVAREDTEGVQRRGGFRTARGKRVPAAEINNYYRVRLFLVTSLIPIEVLHITSARLVLRLQINDSSHVV
ncbi:hypothetical protein BTR22_04855 [Alkalihalophilus pseudofirmus]|nr:hypothetical protein BTR22_04855 [Alkalihalophilus pseudofirmus]